MKRSLSTSFALKSSFAIILLSALISSCDTFLDVKLDSSQIVSDDVFGDDTNADMAVNGIYRNMVLSSFAGGGSLGIASLVGLSSDELHNPLQEIDYVSYESNNLRNDNMAILGLWSEGYQIIFQANDVLESLEKSSGLSDTLRSQLIGEAYFIRAFCHFQLANLFGDVPLALTTDYKTNSSLQKTAIGDVYAQVVRDLLAAEGSLLNYYKGQGRTRPNKAAARALLARTFLYQENWQQARIYSDLVINDKKYQLERDLNLVFKKDSPETIWQLASEDGYNTKENFLIDFGISSGSQVMSDNLVSAFEDGDQRLEQWTSIFSDGSVEFFYPFKYKAHYQEPTTEYYIVLRLAEQFLIRAEAKAHLEDLGGAIADVDSVRSRAQLPLFSDVNPTISNDELLVAIAQERRIELFSEWGHRWFDLKRTNKALTVIGAIKDGISQEDLIYPIPLQEILRNPNILK